MIQIESVLINELRGIRNLSFEPKKSSFAICGPNGTGKSGIVDAIEFCLTGEISRLKGEGTDDVKLKVHGPHVDSKEKPTLATVTINVFIPSLNKSASILRKISEPKKPKITPNDADIISIFKKIEDHPEFTLTRREIIKYILQTPSKRGDQVRSLLKLKKIEDIRKALNAIKNSLEKTKDQHKREFDNATLLLNQSCNIDSFNGSELLEIVNKYRKVLGLKEIESLNDEFLTVDKDEKPEVKQIPKELALKGIDSFIESHNLLSNKKDSILKLIEKLQAILNSGDTQNEISKVNLYNIALEQFDGIKCPVCDKEWDEKEFRNKIAAKIVKIDELNIKIKEAKSLSLEIRNCLVDVTGKYESISNYFEIVNGDKKAIDPIIDLLKNHTSKLIQDNRIDNTISVLYELSNLSESPIIIAEKAKKSISELPEQTDIILSTNNLITVQQRYANYIEKENLLSDSTEKYNTIEHIYSTYVTTIENILENIYSKVRDNFINYYKTIHNDDESNFTADLAPNSGGIDLTVDFYSRGKYPPAAYHSEGHQDGMGLCLYLALMNYIFGDEFTFAVFDDVLMSVDNEHRRHISRLLMDFFPNTQFIITTHDKIWLRLMESHGLIKPNKALKFRSWTVDNGPCDWDNIDVWGEIDDFLSKNDVFHAAATLRNYLEFISIELCDMYQASVHFRADAQYNIGELLPSANKKFMSILSDAIKSAKKWNLPVLEKNAQEFSSDLQSKFKATRAEEWAINPSIHFNTWDTFHKDDLKSIAAQHQSYIKKFYCPDCGFLLSIGYDGNRKAKEVSCKCGRIRFNLQ